MQPQTQERLLGEPILKRLKADLGEAETEQRLLALLEGYRQEPLVEQAYGPDNVLSLLRLLRGHLRGPDLSGLAIRQVHLVAVEALEWTLHPHVDMACISMLSGPS